MALLATLLKEFSLKIRKNAALKSMNVFEKTMTIMGKGVLRILFLFAVMLSCKPCAAYLLNKEKNFECPICLFFKNFHSENFNIASSINTSKICNYNSSVLQSKNNLNKTKFENENSNFDFQKTILFSIKENNAQFRNTFYLYAFSDSGIPLYLLFHNLKIGNCYNLFSQIFQSFQQ
jgi:hypothetical protein